MDSDGMKKYIHNFSFDNCERGNQGYNRLIIQLFGFAGHGKSSFINSCLYALKEGPYKIVAKVSNDKPETMARNSYDLTGSIILVNNRGFWKMNEDETGEVYAQLGNFTPLNSEVHWQETGYEATVEYLLKLEDEDHSADFIVPVLVYSAKAGISDHEFGGLKVVLGFAKKITGVVPTVVITHELSPKMPDVKEKFRLMGVKNIFSLENYTVTDHLKTPGKYETILNCLCEIIKDVEFRMKEKRDPTDEKKKRKQLLLNFIHEREQEKEVYKVERRVQDAERSKQELAKCAQDVETQRRKPAKDCIVM